MCMYVLVKFIDFVTKNSNVQSFESPRVYCDVLINREHLTLVRVEAWKQTLAC